MPASQFRLTSRLPQITAELNTKASALVRATALEIKTDAQESMGGGKSGRWYGSHRASAPGEAPAIDLGVLVASGFMKHAPNSRTAYVGFTAEYAFWLEFGTRHVAARPALSPAFNRAQAGFVRGVRSLLP